MLSMSNRQQRIKPNVWNTVSAFQNTLGRSVVFKGIGTHTAQPITMTIHPAHVDSGIVFARTDLTGGPHLIPALWGKVSDTNCSTTISNAQKVSVSTIEHIMAALYACEIDNAYIEITGGEVPIMDGSSDEFIEPLLNAGIFPQEKPRRSIQILKTILVRDDVDRWISVSPHDEFYMDCEFHFAGRADFPTQHYASIMTPEIFRDEIAAARTFGFVEDVVKLRSMGLAQGSSLENAVCIQEGKIINPEGLRFKDEFVRHKVLDAIGDLYTAGAPIKGCIRGTRTGHGMLNRLLQAVFSNPNNWRYI